MSNTPKYACESLLNGISPYFTMFPLTFPLSILQRHATVSDLVVDPFCGRGTTNFACRLLNLQTLGVDSSPVAVAISQAKLANTTEIEILSAAKEILHCVRYPKQLPTGEFWNWAYHPTVLYELCRLREGLLGRRLSSAEKALRGLVLGALHGPQNGDIATYFSNQAQRTYAPKPKYAVAYWKRHGLRPRNVDVFTIIQLRAKRYYSNQNPAHGTVVCDDSRDKRAFRSLNQEAAWVITSPPYYGMRTYVPDQWLRSWFVGGAPYVDYAFDRQLRHSSPDDFANDLRTVWINVKNICTKSARLVVRFGGINDRKAEPIDIFKASLKGTGWKIETIRSAGSADEGRRQAKHITKSLGKSREEFDIWAKRLD